MYKLVTIRDAIRVPPKKFTSDISESVKEVLREQYENRIDPELGVILAISDVDDLGEGRIIFGDGATYHDLTFEALTFQPRVHETIEGKVSEVVQFGAFVRIGPIDGLVHVSQVTDDFISYNEKTGALSAKDSGKVLKEGDIVKARVVTLSMKSTITDSKIGLTMRQPGLGKTEWVEDAKKGGEKGAEKAAAPKKRSKASKKGDA